MPRLVLVASAMTETVNGPPSGGTIVLAAAAIAIIAGLCLFLLFRRGSITDRARIDVPDAEVDQGVDEVDGLSP